MNSSSTRRNKEDLDFDLTMDSREHRGVRRDASRRVDEFMRKLRNPD